MEIEGKLMQIMPVQDISTQKGSLKKLEFIIEVESKFPRKVCFSLWNEKIDMFTAKVGEMIKVSFDLESRTYNNRWYTEAKAWKVENMQASTPAEKNEPYFEKGNEVPPAMSNQDNEMDDLPF